jgi:hypothetical protein
MIGAPEGIRTPNLLIRSQVLYPLSYGRVTSEVYIDRRMTTERSQFGGLSRSFPPYRRRTTDIQGDARQFVPPVKHALTLGSLHDRDYGRCRQR